MAQVCSTEPTLDEAETTGRYVATLRALWHMATTSVVGFGWAMFVFTDWVFGLSLMALAVIKIIFPNNVGVVTLNGQFHSAGGIFGLPPDAVMHPAGYWIVPVSLLAGLVVLVGTQRASRAILRWLRARTPSARLRLRVEVDDRARARS